MVVWEDRGVLKPPKPPTDCMYTPLVRVDNFEVFLISRFSWVGDDTKIIHVEGGITTREIF